jgi:predicted transposase YbfD/YdcC
MVEARVERKGEVSVERRSYISSRVLSAAGFATAVRSHWEIENSLHWMLDVTFKEDLSRLRRGHGAANMAVVRHFALNLVRQAKDKRAIKRRRKMAAWDPPPILPKSQEHRPANPDSVPWLCQAERSGARGWTTPP